MTHFEKDVMLPGTTYGRTYQVELEPWAEQDFGELQSNIQEQAAKRLKKLEILPRGIPLHGKLKGWYSEPFDNKRFRIVFRFDEIKEKIIVRSIGKRDKDYVYKITEQRIYKENKI